MQRQFKIFSLYLLYFGITILFSHSKLATGMLNTGTDLSFFQAHFIPSTQENIPAKAHSFIFYRNGIDEKFILVSHIAQRNLIHGNFTLSDIRLDNSKHSKYLVSFSSFLAIQPEFFSYYSPHSPPVFC
jgi:hypothetical protein